MANDTTPPPRPPRVSTSLTSGAGILLARRYLVAVMGWAGTLIVIRQLPADAWGGYSFIFGLAGILGIVSDLHIGRIVLVEVMEDPDEAGATITNYMVLRTLLGVLSAVIALVVVVAGDYPSSVVFGMAAAGLSLVIASAANSLVLLFQARLWLRDVAVGSVLGQLAQLIATVALVLSGHVGLVWFAAAAALFPAGELAWYSRRAGPLLRWRVDVRAWGPWLREAAPLAVGAAAASLYMKIDTVMLGSLDSLNSVGIYSVGYKFSDLLGSIGAAVAVPALTMLVDAWPDDPVRFRGASTHAFVLLFVAAVGSTIVFTGFARELISLLYGSRYEVATGASRALVAAQALNFFTQLCFVILVAVGRNRRYAAAMIGGVAVNVGLNFALIPHWSYFGSAIATVVTEVAVLAALGSAVLAVPGIRPLPWRSTARTVAAGAATVVVVLASDDVAWWPLAILASGATYVAALHLLRVGGPRGLRDLVKNQEVVLS